MSCTVGGSEFHRVGPVSVEFKLTSGTRLLQSVLLPCANLMFAIVGLEPCENAEREVTGQAASVLPPDISTLNFQSENDISNSMLTVSDVATVISSYEKTIGSPFTCYFYHLLEILLLYCTYH